MNYARATGLLLLGGLIILAFGLIAQPIAASPASGRAGAAPMGGTATPTPCPRWQFVPSPSVVPTDHVLNGVAAVSDTEVWAVGFYTNTNGVPQTLTERWDGAQWSVVPSPSIGATGGNWLTAVSATSSNDVWAVGYRQLTVGGPFNTLILHWDGTDWEAVASPSPGPDENYLYGVAAVSATDAWAVGYFNNGTLIRTLIMRWNGATWSTVTSPNPLVGGGLRGVTAVSPTEVWAVGAGAGLSLVLQTLVVRWNGSTWSIVPSPNANTSNTNALTAVDASAFGNAWAVGTYSDGTRFHTLIERWNGSTWTIVPGPDPGTGDAAHGGVVALSANEAWAVGGYSTASRAETLAIKWDGAQWTQVPSDNPGTVYNALLSVAASPSDKWAVGSYQSAGPAMTLVERYVNAPCATVTPTPPSATNTPTSMATLISTPTATNTPPGATATPTGTATGPTPTVTPCPMTFTDVLPNDYFYVPVRYLYCAGVISGYADNTFRPYANTTRGQLTKIVVLAFGLPLYTPPSPTFSDVPTTHTFYQYIETAAYEGLVSGYSDGTFRPQNDVTRGQLSKIVVEAAGWPLVSPPTPTFTDVPTGHTFYQHIETAFDRGIISGYADGTFRPGNNATRGQISKIVYEAVIAP